MKLCRTKSRSGSQKGAAMVEAAISIAPIILILAFLVDSTLVLFRWGALTHNAAVVARAVAEELPRRIGASSVQSTASSQLDSIVSQTKGIITVNGSSYDIASCQNLTNGSGAPSFSRISVEASAPSGCVICKIFSQTQELKVQASTSIETGLRSC